MKNFNGRFIEIDGVDVPILLEDGLDIDFAKNILSKCVLKKFKNGDFLIINKDSMHIAHETKLIDVIDDSKCNKEGNPITLTNEYTLQINYEQL